MSEYTSYSYQYSPSVAGAVVGKAAGLSVAALSGVAIGVAVLFQAIREKAAALEATRLQAPEAWLGAIQSEPLVAAAVAQAMPGFPDLARCADRESLTDALPELQRAFEQAHARLLAAEAKVLYAHLSGALAELGYELREPRRPQPGQLLLRAAKAGGTEVTMRLTPGKGRFELDLSGFHGGACTLEKVRIAEALRRRGVVLTEQVTQRHGRCEGGALAAQAREGVVAGAAVRAALRNKERA